MENFELLHDYANENLNGITVDDFVKAPDQTPGAVARGEKPRINIGALWIKVRPIARALTSFLPFIPKKWKDALNVLFTALDAIADDTAETDK